MTENETDTLTEEQKFRLVDAATSLLRRNICESSQRYLDLCKVMDIPPENAYVTAAIVLAAVASTTLLCCSDVNDEDVTDDDLIGLGKSAVRTMVKDIDSLIDVLKAREVAKTVSDEAKEDNGQHGDVQADASGAGVSDES